MDFYLFTLYVTKGLALLTVAGGVLAVFLLILLILQKFNFKHPLTDRLTGVLRKRAIWFVLIVSLIATGGSLFYSEVMGYDPCKLCWFQRILMYPQVVILAIALIWKKRDSLWYALGLSAIGAPLAFYHYMMQRGVVEATSCGVVGYSASCSKYFILQYGYVTIPMMALTAFALIILFAAFRLRKNG